VEKEKKEKKREVFRSQVIKIDRPAKLEGRTGNLAYKKREKQRK